MTACTETRQFFKITPPTRATTRTMTVAMMVARQARVWRKMGLAPRVAWAMGANGFQWPQGTSAMRENSFFSSALRKSQGRTT